MANTDRESLKKALKTYNILFVLMIVFIVIGVVGTTILLIEADFNLRGKLADTSDKSTPTVFLTLSICAITLIILTFSAVFITYFANNSHFHKQILNLFWAPLAKSILGFDLEYIDKKKAPTHYLGTSNIFRWVPFGSSIKDYYHGSTENLTFDYFNFSEATKTEENDGGSFIAINFKKAFAEKLMLSSYKTVYGVEFYGREEKPFSLADTCPNIHLYTDEKDIGTLLNQEKFESLNKTLEEYFKRYSEIYNESTISLHVSAKGNQLFVYFKGVELFRSKNLRSPKIDEDESNASFLLSFIAKAIDLFGGVANE